MAYTTAPSSYTDSTAWTPDASRWDTSLEGTSHAYRRMQHTYSPETGSYIQDAGSYHRGVVDWDPQSPSSSGWYSTSAAGYPQHLGTHADIPRSESITNARYAGAEYLPSPRSTPHHQRSRGAPPSSTSSKASSHRSSSSLATPPRTPDIGRLGTPDLMPVSAGLRFCPCCSTEEDRCAEQEYLCGRSKMDCQVQYAMEHISRSSRKSSGRLPRN